MKKIIIDLAASEKQFELNGSTYTQRWGFDAYAAFEEVTGLNIAIQKPPVTVMNLILLLFCSLIDHHPDLSMETVKSWWTSETAEELSVIAWEAYNGPLSALKQEEGEEPPDPPSA